MLWGGSGSSGSGSGGGLGRGNHSDEFFSAPVHPQTQTDFMNYLFDTALQQEEEVSNTSLGKHFKVKLLCTLIVLKCSICLLCQYIVLMN